MVGGEVQRLIQFMICPAQGELNSKFGLEVIRRGSLPAGGGRYGQEPRRSGRGGEVLRPVCAMRRRAVGVNAGRRYFLSRSHAVAPV